MAVVPDTKDWTWVLDRPCPECGVDVRGIDRDMLPALLRGIAAQWDEVLTTRDDVRLRPAPDVWSPLEYGGHVRDVFRVFDDRLMRMLTEDDPAFDNWDQDATAVARRYDEQDPRAVAEALGRDATILSEHVEGITGDEWPRTGTRSDGAQFTVESLLRYLVHDPLHHLHDVARVVQEPQPGKDQPRRPRTRVPDRGEQMSTDAGFEQPVEPAPPAKKAANGRRRGGRAAKRTTGRTTAVRKTTARKTTARKSTARKTSARKTTARTTTARRAASPITTGALASSLAVLMEQIDAQIASINGLSDTIDGHVSALNQLRAEQQLQVAALLEVRAAAGRDGTLTAYVDERLAELRRPVVTEADHPWPRR